jgi:phage head maturation protease
MARADLPRTRTRPRTIGQVEGIALVYDVVDAHGTTFSTGSLLRSKREDLPAGRIRLFMDHGDSMGRSYYQTRLHIGTVRRLTFGTLADGRKAEMMVADVFDTPAGQEAVSYVAAVLANQTLTGLSIAFRDWEGDTVRMDGKGVYRFTDVGLIEVSITAMPSVPGAYVTAVRQGPVIEELASEDDRVMAVRQSYQMDVVASMAERRKAAGMAA